MLIEFQQALADLVASPALCQEILRDPKLLAARYCLTERELNRLFGVVEHRGMECNCMLYRANRLAPLALNLPQTCSALGSNLRTVLDDYWAAYPKTDVHFIVESYRFCEFVQQRLRDGAALPASVEAALALEMPTLALRLGASYTEVGATPRAYQSSPMPVSPDEMDLSVAPSPHISRG